MRRTLSLAGAALLSVVIAENAMALSEPEPVASGDAAFRSVPFKLGEVIRLVGARGEILPVEMPRGWQVFGVNASTQNVMDGVAFAGDRRGSAAPAAPAPAEGSESGCTMHPNIEICVQRERFIMLKPLTQLDPQPVHVIMLRPIKGKEPEEIPVIFRLETTQAGTSGAAQQYYVRVTLPEPPAPPPAPAASVSRGTSPVSVRPVARPRPAPEPVAPEPPEIFNNAYTVIGDRNLLGVPGR